MNRHREKFFKASPILEAQNSVLSFVVGAVFLANYITGRALFEQYPDLYRLMTWAPMYAWGLVFAGAGLIHLISVFGDYYLTRKTVLLFKFFLWCNIAICTIQGDAFVFTGWFYAVFAFSAGLSFLRLKRIGEPYEPSHVSLGA
jgi:hypothetical protein